MKFEREEGFFTGAYLINFAITEGLMFLVLMAYVLWKSQNPDAPWALPLMLGGFFALVAPIVFYPFARTIWTAIHLALAPLDPPELAAAREAVDEAGDRRPLPPV